MNYSNIQMESIIEKLDKIGEPTKGLDTWSLEEKNNYWNYTILYLNTSPRYLI